MYIVSRAINGISINGKEYILDNDNNVMEFESTEDAILFLSNNGIDYNEYQDDINIEEQGK